MRKIDYSDEERKTSEEKQKRAEEQAEEIRDIVLETSINIQAQEETSEKLLGLGKMVIEKLESHPLSSPYQDWKISFHPRAGQLGALKLNFHTDELRRELMLDHSEENMVPLIKILFEQFEVLRFTKAVKEGVKKIEGEFNGFFEQKVKSFAENPTPEQIAEVVRKLNTERERNIFKNWAFDEITKYVRGKREILPPVLARWEDKIFGKPVAVDILETAGKGLKR